MITAAPPQLAHDIPVTTDSVVVERPNIVDAVVSHPKILPVRP